MSESVQQATNIQAVSFEAQAAIAESSSEVKPIDGNTKISTLGDLMKDPKTLNALMMALAQNAISDQKRCNERVIKQMREQRHEK